MLTPSRGIGKTSLEKIIEFTIKHNCTIEEALTHPECPLQNRFVSIIETFIKSIKDINSENISISEKLDKILTAVNFDQHLRKLENTQDRHDNIQELKSKLKDIKSLENFLEDITLFQGSDDDNSTGKVRCLTLHLAKGLEFPVVFIPGFEERLLPST